MNVIVTGGEGNLAKYIRELRPGFIYLGHSDLDVTDTDEVKSIFSEYNPDICIHLAANTDVAYCEREHKVAFQVNTLGTRNIAKACNEHETYLVYTSTDYVFDGEEGLYNESDPPNPVNYYGLTKLLGEYEAKCVSDYLIVRGTMKQTEGWKHPKVPDDMYESILFYDEFARILLRLVDLSESGIIHLGKKRYNLYQVAKSRRSDVSPIKVDDIKSVRLPKDCSLDVSKLKSIVNLEEVLDNVPQRL